MEAIRQFGQLLRKRRLKLRHVLGMLNECPLLRFEQVLQCLQQHLSPYEVLVYTYQLALTHRSSPVPTVAKAFALQLNEVWQSLLPFTATDATLGKLLDSLHLVRQWRDRIQFSWSDADAEKAFVTFSEVLLHCGHVADTIMLVAVALHMVLQDYPDLHGSLLQKAHLPPSDYATLQATYTSHMRGPGSANEQEIATVQLSEKGKGSPPCAFCTCKDEAPPKPRKRRRVEHPIKAYSTATALQPQHNKGSTATRRAKSGLTPRILLSLFTCANRGDKDTNQNTKDSCTCLWCAAGLWTTFSPPGHGVCCSTQQGPGGPSAASDAVNDTDASQQHLQHEAATPQPAVETMPSPSTESDTPASSPSGLHLDIEHVSIQLCLLECPLYHC